MLLCIEEIVYLTEECRYLAARELYETYLVKIVNESDAMRKQCAQLLEIHCEVIELMLRRSEEVKQTLDYDGNDVNWTLGVSYLDVTTHYRECEDNSIIVKLDGILTDLPLFEQFAVIHEIDLFKEWAPLCNESDFLDKIGRAEVIAYLKMGIPTFSRDMLLSAYGADCLLERGIFCVVGSSIMSGEVEGITVPWKEAGWFHDRCICRQFKIVIELLSPTTCKTTIITHLDLNSSIPTMMINFFIKNCAGILLYIFKGVVTKVHENHECEHALRIKQNTALYRDWILPKLRLLYAKKGWDDSKLGILFEEPPQQHNEEQDQVQKETTK